MKDIFVVGADMIKFGRFPEKSVPELAAEATRLALDDCGLAISDIQALYCGNIYESHMMVGQRLMREIGMTGIPVVNVANACATGATAFREALLAIASGSCDIALAVGVEQMGKGLLGSAQEYGFRSEGVIGSDTTPAMFALVGSEHQRLYGTTFAQFAKVAVKNHKHATLNPKAMYRLETPLEQVMAAEMIAYPNTKLMCSANVDGAAAAILASRAAVERLGLGRRAVRVRASAMSSDPYDTLDLATTDFSTATRLAAAAAYEQAGLGPEELDLVELHDCFATAELVHYENLGLCGPGEAGSLIDRGETALGGRLPVNVSGGLLSKGHPLGATGIANICEIAAHLRGEAGARQVAQARFGLTHVVGGAQQVGSACAIHILERPENQ
ncbi:MAG TPA: thiolase family protein [Pararhizobium sp.]|uniref:thiolase family protein n=1 Tax=Pararhizobium sp. TaxID=1977563 RepID=UPI002D09D58B|nr:thiolase family protein [Pararhizobium sp.]HTO32290.1 thiolase family protein [Pararhizobium sp.]